MSLTLEQSYAHCRQLARSARSNFYPCFRVLPAPKQQAMYALYAFFRHTDDLTDGGAPASPATRHQWLSQWRAMLGETLSGQAPCPISPALRHTVEQFGIPPEYLYAALEGAEMDLQGTHYRTEAELLKYCYNVASAVGLACIHVWGFTNDAARLAAVQCGYAFQMTNILRDLKEDAARGRVYLPQENLDRFQYSADDLRQGVLDERYRQLMAFELDCTARHYQQARELFRYLHADGQAIYRVMLSAYGCLFAQIRRRQGDVFTRRIRIDWPTRLRLAAGIWISPAMLPEPVALQP